MEIKEEEKLSRRRSWAEVQSPQGFSLHCGGSEAGMALQGCPDLHWLVFICGLPRGAHDLDTGGPSSAEAIPKEGWKSTTFPPAQENKSFNFEERIWRWYCFHDSTFLILLVSVYLLCVNSGASYYRILVGLRGILTWHSVRQTTAPTIAVSFKATNDTHSLSPLLTIQNSLLPWLPLLVPHGWSMGLT